MSSSKIIYVKMSARESENKRLKTAMDKWLGKSTQSTEEAMETENREFKLHKFEEFAKM